VSEQSYVVCVCWGEQVVDSDPFKCCECGKDIALDKRNVVPSEKSFKICMLCASRKFGERPASDFRLSVRWTINSYQRDGS
jgi:hypothetical protein